MLGFQVGQVLRMGHSHDEKHLMYGTANPTPDKTFADLGYTVLYLSISNFENIGGDHKAREACDTA